MADDMNNGSSFDPLASYARLSERVENQGRDIVDLRSNMNTGFRNIEGAVNALSTELRGSSKTQWPVLLTAVGVAFTILVAAGSQALSPIRDNVSDVKGALSTIVDKMVTQQEMKWRTDRGTEDRTRTEASLASIRDTMVYRNEWMERNLSRDHDIENIRADAVRDVANLQRQIDQQETRYQAFSSSLGNGRDFIIDLKAEQSRLRDQIAALTAKVAAEQAAAPR
ncbi:hypothetical protein OHD62_17245 [Mesorhizobium sp. YC-39]|uniref:hypothetical protein n=1 Tax=unclassified Mesorhizobium TaxID=325217 RepID=UPI0021E91950|nr:MULTISPECIES: hypothetical protein [unclassified Mesorhizobium]MCV3209589.1 hypothetical protein [Mesorhizobium sp. YC-2]MCV3230119.1 hypothetical protein [Mesorhizobium sp. YC-39]